MWGTMRYRYPMNLVALWQDVVVALVMALAMALQIARRSYPERMATWHHADTLSMIDRGAVNQGTPLDKTPAKIPDRYFKCAELGETRGGPGFKSQDVVRELGWDQSLELRLCALRTRCP